MAMRLTRDNTHTARVHFNGLCGNGLTYARRDTLRVARKLHLVANRTVFCDVIEVKLYTRKDENRLAELWKYLCGRKFQAKCLNNGCWENEG